MKDTDTRWGYHICAAVQTKVDKMKYTVYAVQYIAIYSCFAKITGLFLTLPLVL